MSLTAVAPIKAYSNTLNPGASVSPGAGAGLPSFNSFLQDSGQEMMAIGRSSESLSANALLGKSNLTDVTTAVTSAELALQGVIAIRDKLVGSIQEIMRMPV
ncbi:MAG: flagellar hook-basal body complex protein FliE [Alphaproteobacteria bacterium]|jgi:flagellar hook-basal body complex protein FliE|nr:flagellar hook-basal body complex protein FliE [Thalassospira sp.]MCE2965014.1 flagellar hook-basal body complex protein FliE [Alphaproteobacteria bacterium]